MKRILIIFISISIFSCEPKVNQPKIDQHDASVQRIQGICIFILSEPKVKYEILGQVKNNIGDQLDNNVKGKKKFLDIMGGLISTTSDNVDFKKLLNHMITITKEKYPKVDAVIFDFNLGYGTAIKFND